MITLGLDPSLTGFGWAVHQSTVVGPERVLAKGVISTPASWLYVRRYMYLRSALGEVLTAYPEVQNVGAESNPFGAEYSEGLYGLFVYVTECLFTMRRDVVFFDPSTVKSLAKMDSRVRRGKLDKQDIIEAARVDTTVKKWNHNEADAYVIGRAAAHFWEFLEGTLTLDDLTPSEANTFLGVETKKNGRQGGLSSKEGSRFFRFSKLTAADVEVPSYRIDRK